MGDTLPIYTGTVGKQEPQDALRALSTGKAAGVDDVPPELWKALARSPKARGELLIFFLRSWDEKDIPDEWLTSIFALLHKKGDASLP